MMLNLAGLEYWEQKYQRFLIHEDGDYIRFQGGPIFVQLPGFGLLAKKGGTSTIYGLGTPEIDKYADLSGYSKLILTVTSGRARIFFNAINDQPEGRITVGTGNNEASQYLTVNNSTYTIDLNAIWFDHGKAHLNSIKSGAWNENATITSMELVPYEGTPVKWNFDNTI